MLTGVESTPDSLASETESILPPSLPSQEYFSGTHLQSWVEWSFVF